MNPIFATITKVDEVRQEVTGRAVQEMVDRDGEVFDYNSSKPEFQKWSAEVFQDTAGASLGNVRAMHGNTCAGKLVNIDFNDAELAIDVTAKIVDPIEWKKITEGCYSGFSIGGQYARKWTEASNGKIVTRYTAKPTEISIVDRPCVPAAKFYSVHKADGRVLRRQIGQPIRDRSIDAIKKIHGAGAMVYKGDAPGHEFRGNQHIGGGEERHASAAQAHAARAAEHGGKKSQRAAALSTKAGLSRGTSGERIDAHVAAQEAHLIAGEKHDDRGNKAATDAHYAAATAHGEAVVAIAREAKKFDGGDATVTAIRKAHRSGCRPFGPGALVARAPVIELTKGGKVKFRKGLPPQSSNVNPFGPVANTGAANNWRDQNSPTARPTLLNAPHSASIQTSRPLPTQDDATVKALKQIFAAGPRRGL